MNSAIGINLFNAGLNENSIPCVDSISYLGAFSTEFFPLNEENTEVDNDEILSLQISSALISGDFNKVFEKDVEKNAMLGCQLFSKYDGKGNRNIPIDLVILLDISYSMQSKLDGSSKSCLDLAKSAILKLKYKLRDDDRIALVTFNDYSDLIFDLQSISKIENYDEKINSIIADGSTIISFGMNMCYDIMNENINKSNENRLRRIILLTDMNDCESNGDLENSIKKCSEKNIFISIIGIGFSLNVSLTEKISKTKGFNYFTALKEDHINNIIVENFDLNFFPIAYNINLQIESGDLSVEKVYGTNFDNKLQELNLAWKTSNHFLQNNSVRKNVEIMLLYYQRTKNRNIPMPVLANLIKFWDCKKHIKNVCEISSCSATEKKDKHIQGKFFIIKCKIKKCSQIFYRNSFAFAKIILSYDTLEGEKKFQIYNTKIHLDKEESIMTINSKYIGKKFYIEKNIALGLAVFYYTKLLRKMLRAYENKYVEKYFEFLEEKHLKHIVHQLDIVLIYLLSENYPEKRNDFIEKIKTLAEKITENMKNYDPNYERENFYDEDHNISFENQNGNYQNMTKQKLQKNTIKKTGNKKCDIL